jgi:hypothetical protein
MHHVFCKTRRERSDLAYTPCPQIRRVKAAYTPDLLDQDESKARHTPGSWNKVE